MTPRKPSLNSRLALHVMLPLVVTWAIGAAVTVTVANVFTQQAFDRSLLDDAHLLASRVALRDGRLALTLTSSDMSTLLFDPDETEYFAVLAPGGALVAGHAGLPAATAGAGADERPAAEFGDLHYQGRDLRGVTLRLDSPAPFSVVVAQTTATRSRLLQRLVAYSVTAQLALLLALAWWLRRAIRADLAPLAALQQAVDERDASDLTPVSASLTEGASSRDVERLGVAVNALLARLGESIRAQQEFSGNVAHELRTPLAGIRALADYGLAQGRPEVWREQLQAIARSEQRASHLVDQLLALALADEAESSLRFEPVALHEVARDVVLQFLPRADAAGVDLGASGLDRPLTVTANAALVEGLLVNLLDNALRYGRGVPGRRAMVTVELAVRQGGGGTGEADGAATLSVIDNGPGLAPEERQRLVRRWAQGPKAERLGEGAGLGLAIVARYAELLHARLELADGLEQQGLRATVVFDKSRSVG
jgi:two-component system sensor histidine kinase TctE